LARFAAKKDIANLSFWLNPHGASSLGRFGLSIYFYLSSSEIVVDNTRETRETLIKNGLIKLTNFFIGERDSLVLLLRTAFYSKALSETFPTHA
jgi:hypothetical protein